MSDLGQLLKKARIHKGMTLDELQDVTKIRKRYLEAIEEGNYKVLPGHFYVRAFIKSYSETVGLEPEEVLKLYRSEVPAAIQEPVVEPIRKRSRPAPRNTDKFARWASVFLLIAFPLLIIGVLYYYNVFNSDPNEPIDQTLPLTDNRTNANSANDQQQEPVNEEPEPEPQTPPAPEPELTLEKSEGNTDYYVLKNANQLLVNLEIIGDSSWMAIRKESATGEFVEQNLTLKKGDSRQWTFEGSAFFHFGKSNALQVTINNLPINVGDAPNPRKLQITLQPSETQ